ncbi:MAG: fasciclin domain-containing protein [Bacteroidaceae bacterium]|nr:fasciclin domain-containing protein [Bacteroidaceae bacterium]
MVTLKIYKYVSASLIASAICLGTVSCTDDHFNVDTSGAEGGNATQTLWEQISSRGELSNFATLLSNTPYFKDENQVYKKQDGTSYTLMDALNGSGKQFTVFAPTNTAFTATDLTAALNDLTDPDKSYEAFLKYGGNNIVNFRYDKSGSGEEDLYSLNGKKVVFDRATGSYKGIPLKQANIAATNGILHTMDEAVPFSYNLDQLIRLDNRFSKLRQWIIEHDTIYFSESLSAEGGSDENGNPIYVDSVYSRQNQLYSFRDYEEANEDWLMPHKSFRAYLNNEDSIWAMAIPTDAAWDAAMDKLDSMFIYSPAYADKEKENAFTTKNASADPLICDADSLKELAKRMEIASTLVFNLRQQPRDPGAPFWTIETFTAATDMPSMFNTRLDTFFVLNELGERAEHGDVRNWIFQGSTPETMSNGLAYPIDNWCFWNRDNCKDLDIKVSLSSVFQLNLFSGSYEHVSFASSNSKLTTDSLLGSVSDNYFLYFRNGTAAPKVDFKLYDSENKTQVLSGVPYKVGIVMVPDFFRNNTDSIVGDSLKNLLAVQIKYINGASLTGRPSETTKKFDNVTYEGNKVDTIWVGEITFPYTYRNITESYPVMTIESKAKNTAIYPRGRFQHPFSIDRIILKAKKEE